MLTIHQPEVIRINGKSRLQAELEFDGKERKTLWYEVDAEYEKYLCHERSDAFLIGVLPHAMRNSYDISCTAPVTVELAYNLNEHLIPSLCKYNPFHHPCIMAPYASEKMATAGAVGTALSCGVDSFHAVANHWQANDARPRLTHLCINNTGSFDFAAYGKRGIDKVRTEVYARAKQVACHLGLPLITSNSNIHEIFKRFLSVHSYLTSFAIYAMQKLWQIYLFPSSGLDYSSFSISGKIEDSAIYDLLSLNCFSTPQLRIYPEGNAKDRIEKLDFIADFPLARKYLHCCILKENNCGVCSKCRRTMLMLDFIGKLELFGESFPVDYYKAHLDEYLKWLAKMMLNRDIVNQPLYMRMQESNYSEKFKNIVAEMEKTIPAHG